MKAFDVQKALELTEQLNELFRNEPVNCKDPVESNAVFKTKKKFLRFKAKLLNLHKVVNSPV